MSSAGTFLIALKPHEFYSLVRQHRAWFTPMQAAAYLGVKPRTLEAWRAKGAGPAFRGRGKNIRYHIDDLDSFNAGDPRTPPVDSALSLSGLGNRSVSAKEADSALSRDSNDEI